MISNTMSNLQSSILKFVKTFIDTQPGFQFVNFDAHANDSEAPPGNLIGPIGFSFDVEEGFITVTIGFGVSTESDTNLMKLSNTMGQLVELVKPTKRLRIVDSESGQDLGWMIVTGKVRVSPVGGTQAKPVQYVMLTLTTSETFEITGL